MSERPIEALFSGLAEATGWKPPKMSSQSSTRDIEEEEAAINTDQQLDPRTSITIPPDIPHLLNLPVELQTQIISSLTLCDIQSLRQSSPFYHTLVTPTLIRHLFTPAQLAAQTSEICGRCFFNGPSPKVLVRGVREAFEARCSRCAIEDRGFNYKANGLMAKETPNGLLHLRIQKVEGPGWSRASFCRWCARPVFSCTGGTYHLECGEKHDRAERIYPYLIAFRTLLILVSVSLGLAYYKAEKIVLVPSILIILILGVLWVCTSLRGTVYRTYHWTGFLETLLFGCCIPPTYFFAKHIHKQRPSMPKGMTTALLVLFSINLFIRLLNILGNIALYCEYTPIKSYRKLPRWRKIVYKIQFALSLWSSPKFLRNYPIMKPPLDREVWDASKMARWKGWWNGFLGALFRHPSDIDY